MDPDGPERNIRPISPGLDLLLRGYVGCCSAPWRAARSRIGEPSGGGDAAGLEPGLAQVKDKQMWGFPSPSHTHTDTRAQRSSEQQAEAHGWLARARRAASLWRARARARRSGSALGCSWPGCYDTREHLQEKGWLDAKAGSQARATRRTTHDTAARHHPACVSSGLPE
jgi:hypothetical protein